MSRSTPPPPASTSSALLSPAGWTELLKAARSPSERELLDVLARRAESPIAGVEELIELATIEEAQALAELASRLEESAPQLSGYARHKERMAEKAREQSRLGRDIGPLPPVKDPERRAACERDLRLYLETYHARKFRLAWSEDHLRVLAKAQLVVLVGAMFALAMPRGNGKTTILERVILWAIKYGHHFYAMLVGATEPKADKALAKVQRELLTNPALGEDFPEVCYPLRKLEGIHNRAKGQLLDGQPTSIELGKRQLVLPTVPGSRASGAIVETGGLLSAVRGAQYLTVGGEVLRPTLLLIDDPQTRESARSQEQTGTREEIVAADLLGMVGPDDSIAALMPCTVIAPGDMADRLLDKELHPEWRGERMKLLYAFPENLDLWEEYWQLFCDALRTHDDADAVPKEATAFYLEHREAMDKGAVVAWESRKRKDEFSAIQHCMNLWLRNPSAFASEYQNEPLLPTSDDRVLTVDEIAQKVTEYRRRQVPKECTWLTAFIDVHKRCLYWGVCGWAPDFTGFCLDYGCFPKANRSTWTQDRIRPTLGEIYKGAGTEGAIYKGLTQVMNDLLGRTWERDDQAPMQINRLLIDTSWDTNTIRKFCRESPWKAVTMPSFGREFGPNSIPISQWKKRPGELLGDEWKIQKLKGREVPHVTFDANHWKTQFHRRLATPVGDPGAFALFGREASGKGRADHNFFARHLDAEYRQPLAGVVRQIDNWQPKPGHSQNHWLDVMVGCTIAASLCGASPIKSNASPEGRGRISLKRLQEEKRRRRAA